MSNSITSQQSLAMANLLSQLLGLIGKYKQENFDHLTDAQKNDFGNTLKALSDAAGQLFAQTVVLALKEADKAIGNLEQANDKIDGILTTISNIQKWIDISAAAFRLATAVVTAKPGEVTRSIKGLADAAKSA